MSNQVETSEIKKIKSQKQAAVFLIAGSAILLLLYISKDDLEKYGNNNYYIIVALLTLNVIGFIAFFRSYIKLKKLM